MSERWEQYFTRIDEKPVSIIYDHGIAGKINDLADVKLLWIQMELAHTDEHGLPCDPEWEVIDAVESALDTWAQQRFGRFVGSISTDGTRAMHCYVNTHDEEVHRLIQQWEMDYGREFGFLLKDDPEREAYWDDLFPDDDEWRLLMDTKGVDHLQQNGDCLVEPRRVDHLLFFTHRELAEEFVKWAMNAETEADYKVEELRGPTEDFPRFALQIYHETPVTLEAITPHTRRLEEKARELGGEYDGWETFLLLDEPPESAG